MTKRTLLVLLSATLFAICNLPCAVWADGESQILRPKTISIANTTAQNQSPSLVKHQTSDVPVPVRTDTRQKIHNHSPAAIAGAQPTVPMSAYLWPFHVDDQKTSPIGATNSNLIDASKRTASANANIQHAYAQLSIDGTDKSMVRQVVGLQPVAVTDLQKPRVDSPNARTRASRAMQSRRFLPVASVPDVPTLPAPMQQPIVHRAPKQLVRQAIAQQEQFLPALPTQVHSPTAQIPVERTQSPRNVSIDVSNELVTLEASRADLPSVLRLIAEYHGLNLVVGPDVDGPVTVSIRGARLDEVLDGIVGVAGFGWHRVGNLLYVTGKTTGMDARVQGRYLRVYPLDYVASKEIEGIATTLLSNVGTIHSVTAQVDDHLRTRELLVVEDTDYGHNRIANYIAQVDMPPRQVLIEAHVLQIALDEEERHGINLRNLVRVDGARVTLEGAGLAEEGTNPSVALRVDGTDMDALIEAIRSSTNSRTLASPKVSVVNHQEAKIQIGQKLPYSVATTTQTSTIQSINFLEVGIVLTVRPVITDDGNILMTVLPKVSGGRITESGFPEEDTTEVSTTVLMPNGGGLVIGGLIREEDTTTHSRIPGFSRVPLVGRLFRRRAQEARRNELVVALVTHVLPDVHQQRSKEMNDLNMTIPDYARPELRSPGMLGGQGYEHIQQGQIIYQ